MSSIRAVCIAAAKLGVTAAAAAAADADADVDDDDDGNNGQGSTVHAVAAILARENILSESIQVSTPPWDLGLCDD